MNISTIDGYGARFNFEPPIEVGELNVQTLQDLAVVAIIGSENTSEFIHDVTQESVAGLLKASAAKPEMIRAALNGLLAGKHDVTLV